MLLCAACPMQSARPREFEITPQSWRGIAIQRTRMNRGHFLWLFPIGMADQHLNCEGAILLCLEDTSTRLVNHEADTGGHPTPGLPDSFELLFPQQSDALGKILEAWVASHWSKARVHQECDEPP
jgi:hypothetical protein